MTRFATRLTTVAAVACVAFAQVAVAPASCCLIRTALFGKEACCHPPVAAADPGSRSCCHGPKTKAVGAALGHRHAAPPTGECLWCSAGPKVVATDRVAAPAPELAPASAPIFDVEPAAGVPAADELVLDEPFHRTAVAACAWLCVWRK